MASNSYDVIVYGASSFVGQIVTRYLWAKHGLRDLNWAIAGRSTDKLQRLKDSLGSSEAQALPVLTADARDEGALRSLCEQAKVVISTVGPYALHGEALVKACSESGTDYCDLTGEVQWMRRMIDRYQTAAEASGARIVHACGFDSIPSDLGVYFCQQQATQRYGEYCKYIKMRVRKMRGGMSGGTVASMINGTKEALADRQLRKLMANPYALCPPNHGYWVRQHNPQVEYDEDLNTWTAPFIMSAINTRVVFRSNALQGDPYGKDFRYDEASLVGRGNKGMMRGRGLQAGMSLFGFGVALPPSRWVLERFVLPKPGEGPSPSAQERGFWEMDFIGRLADGRRIHVEVTGDRDPGYGSTAKMLSEAATCLLRDVSKEEVRGGFWTPASALDGKLIDRLKDNAGLSFTVIE